MSFRKKIDSLVIGDCFFDIGVRLSSFKRAIKIGGAAVADDIQVLPGGTGNVAVATSRLGGSVAFCGVVGDDPLGCAYIDDLKMNSVIPMMCKNGTQSTGILVVLLSRDGERSFLVCRGANDYLDMDHIRAAFKRFDPKVVFISGYSITKKSMEPILLGSVELAINNNSKFVFDCTPFNLISSKRQLFLDIISKSYCTCMNLKEARALVGTPSLKEIVRFLRCEANFSALKLGFQGCLLITKRRTKRIRAKKVVVRDTNGAGDCFAGAITYGISKNFTELEMGTLGVAMGTLKVQHHGPRLPASENVKAKFL